MRVLVVEDDRVLGMFLQRGLMTGGNDVQWVGDGESALEHAGARQPHLMVLDLGLPGLDGTEVLAQMKAKYKKTSVLVLSGRSNVQERIDCLNLGAEDCVLKPFNLNELVARCTAILRRKAEHGDPILRHGELEMNRVNRSVRRSGRIVELTVKEFALLEFLLLRQGETCTRSELLRDVWQMPAGATTNIVDVYVNYLRRKLAVDPAASAASATSPVIDTVRGTGYRLSAVQQTAETSANSHLTAFHTVAA